MLTAHPLPTIGEIRPGDDLAAILSEAVEAAGLSLKEFDVLVVTQKICSSTVRLAPTVSLLCDVLN